LPSNNNAGYAQILAQPQSHWREMKNTLQAAFNAHANGRQIPIAASEYNVVSVQDQDNEALMPRAVNALFIADSIGQAIQNGYLLTNQWDLVNGCASNGTCYDLLQVDHNYYRPPQYYAFPLWARFGAQMLNVSNNLNASSQLAVYAGRIDANTLSLLAINKTRGNVNATITFDPAQNVSGGTADALHAAYPGATSVTYNNVADPSDDLSNAPALPLNASGSSAAYTFAPNSITLLRMTVGGAPTSTPTRTATPSSTLTRTPTRTPTATLANSLFLPFITK
jgi:hypothetical protein